MGGWRVHNGRAVALPLENVDTDQLIPARFMSVPRAKVYGEYLLHDMRFDATGQPGPDMVLNHHPRASVLVTRRNFGCGSSREAAVYALVDAGFRAVIAPGFGDIFASNAINNGLLPAGVSSEAAEALIARLGDQSQAAVIDLESGAITVGDQNLRFDLDPTWRTKLINGWDDIDLTRAETTRIAAFRAQRKRAAPWAWPHKGTG